MDFEIPRFITQHAPTLAALRLLDASHGPAPLVASGPSGVGKTALARWLTDPGAARRPGRAQSANGRESSILALIHAASLGPLIVEDADQLSTRAQAQLARAARQRPLALRLTVRDDTGGGDGTSLEHLGLAPELVAVVGNRHIHLPPLAARRRDIPLLIEHLRPAFLPLEPAAVRLLEDSCWPDNVKGLCAVLRASVRRARAGGARAVAVGHVQAVMAISTATAPLGAGLSELAVAWEGHETFEGLPLKRRVRLLEATLLVRALHTASGNAASAARSLGTPPSSFKSRLAALAEEVALISPWVE